jgi:UDP-N-acetylglucosamine 4,6-dehydratase
LESTGSVIPVYKDKIKNKQNLKITHKDMSRFLISLPEAVQLIFSTFGDYGGKKVYIPRIKSAKIEDLADCFIKKSGLDLQKEYTSVRPGEKLAEILFSSEETPRIQKLENTFVLHDIKNDRSFKDVNEEYSSGAAANLMNKEELMTFLENKNVFEGM